jgi:hypothetical protein
MTHSTAMLRVIQWSGTLGTGYSSARNAVELRLQTEKSRDD